jgi:hypothetical protein
MADNAKVVNLRKIRKELGIDPSRKCTTAQSKRDMLAALRARLGIVTVAAEIAGVSRRTHYNWIDENDPTFDLEYKKAVDDVMEMQLDFSESQLFKNIQAGKEASNIFHLRCKGKKRGYIQGEELRVGNIPGEDMSFGIPNEAVDKILEAIYAGKKSAGPGAPASVPEPGKTAKP